MKNCFLMGFVFLFALIKGQIIYNNQFNGYFIKADGGMSLNLLSEGVIDHSNGTPYGLSTKRTDKISPQINLGLVHYKTENFAWNIGVMYTEASLKYRYGSKSSPFIASNLNPLYVYSRSISHGEGYLIRKILGINGGIYLRTPVIDFKINIGICKYFTFKQLHYYYETEYKVYGSSTQFHTEEFHSPNGSYTVTVPNDSVVQITNQSATSSGITQTNWLVGNPILNPSFFDMPIEFSFEKSIFIKPVIVTLGVRTSMTGIAKYVGVGFYLGIGFGRVK